MPSKSRTSRIQASVNWVSFSRSSQCLRPRKRAKRRPPLTGFSSDVEGGGLEIEHGIMGTMTKFSVPKGLHPVHPLIL